MKVKYLNAARDEYYDQIRWMKFKGYPLTVIEKFIREIEQLENEILDPKGQSLVSQPEFGERKILRTSRSKTFSFRLYYVRKDGVPVVIAAAHPSREPGYWSERV